MQSCNYALASITFFIGALLACTNRKASLWADAGIPEGKESEGMVVQEVLSDGCMVFHDPKARRAFLIHPWLITPITKGSTQE